MIVFDLDDTLYKEKDFVESGISFLRTAFPERDISGIWDEEMLVTFRSHVPDITLDPVTESALRKLKDSGHRLGIITDGRSVTQRNKIKALGLDKFVEPDAILISEENGTDKISGTPFKEIMRRFPDETPMVYVGDNPAKDFFQPNSLGWKTIMLADDGKNIHLQTTFTDNGRYFQAGYTIESISELPDLLMKIC